MMERLFLTVLHRGMATSYLILAVAIVRFLLKKAPKGMICLLWMVVGFRLLCPFRIETVFSLVPEQAGSMLSMLRPDFTAQEARVQEAVLQEETVSGIPAVPETDIGPAEAEKAPEHEGMAARTAAAWVWTAGVFLMLAYLAESWHRVRKDVAEAVPAEASGIRFYQCSRIPAPFLFGLAAPKIFVPFSVSGQELSYVLKHEQAHKRRYDHLAKLIGYLLLAAYWFQPFVWAAYLLFCRDMELACDESVIKEIGEDYKKAYSQALLSCASRHRAAAVCPAALGGIGMKKRIKSILNYKKPGRMAVLAAAAVCVAVTVCFATEAGSKSIPQAGGDTRTAQAANAAENGKKVAFGQEDLDAVTESVEKWAEAFCGRDAGAVYGMLDDTGKKQLSDAGMLDGEHSFGWSSPWPWETGGIDGQQNYQILSVAEDSARILYYAWTSDPHVTVWHQVLTYQYAEDIDGIVVHDAAVEVLDSIHNADQFFTAYPDGQINGTQMDYYQGNGVGEALNRNILQSDDAGLLCQPETAAAFLLNIQDDPSAVRLEAEEQDGGTAVTFTFLEDGSTASVKMVQPFGEQGIWVPQTDTASGGFV